MDELIVFQYYKKLKLNIYNNKFDNIYNNKFLTVFYISISFKITKFSKLLNNFFLSYN